MSPIFVKCCVIANCSVACKARVKQMKQDLFWHGICHLFVKIGNAPTPVVVHVKMECVFWIREVLTLDNPSMVSVPLCTKLEMSDINKRNVKIVFWLWFAGKTVKHVLGTGYSQGCLIIGREWRCASESSRGHCIKKTMAQTTPLFLVDAEPKPEV